MTTENYDNFLPHILLNVRIICRAIFGAKFYFLKSCPIYLNRGVAHEIDFRECSTYWPNQFLGGPFILSPEPRRDFSANFKRSFV